MKKEAAQNACGKVFIAILLLTLLIGFVTAGDVAYIYKNKVAVDEKVVETFEELGLTVDLIDEKNLPRDFSGYQVLYIGDERYRNSQNFPIYTVPTIISNYYFGEQFGLTDHDGISQLGSSNPLSVKKNNQVIQVYTRADENTVAIPYYYLAKEDKAAGVQTVAVTYTGDNFDLGDVIGYIPAQTQLLNNKKPQKNICFFGIIESKYWTSEAESMFKDCVQFVGVVCETNSDCPASTNSTAFCRDNNVYIDVHSFTCQNPGNVQSACVVQNNSVLLEDCPGSCLNGACVCQDKDNDTYDECSVGNPGDDGKPVDCNDNDPTVHPNATEICDGKDNDCDGIVDEESNACGAGSICHLGTCQTVACFNNSECGTDGFIETTFCQTNDVYQKYKIFTCNNAGTVNSSCSSAIENRVVDDCTASESCQNGMCIKQCVDNDQDTYDTCSPGETGDDGKPIDCNDNDASVNPGASELLCNGKDNDCDALIDEDYVQTPTSCGVGECSASGMKQCTNGTETNNCTPKTPSAEICDAKDNDCEGIVDEESNACGAGSICHLGSCVEQCVDKDYDTYDTCSPGMHGDDGKPVDCNDNDASVNPGANEVCDGKDNDCDGIVDENNGMCPSGKICSAGSCVAVTCSYNSDCGSDGFVDGLFCGQDGDVYQKYKTFTCNNPGSLQSSCSSSIDNRKVEDCAAGKTCSNGMCVRQCMDRDTDTYDDCHPGTGNDDGKPVDCNDNDASVNP